MSQCCGGRFSSDHPSAESDGPKIRYNRKTDTNNTTKKMN